MLKLTDPLLTRAESKAISVFRLTCHPLLYPILPNTLERKSLRDAASRLTPHFSDCIDRLNLLELA